MMLTTGMLMFGKMSVGVRTIESPPMIRMSMDTTTKVYGRLSASLTIHIIHPSGLAGSISQIDLLPVFRSLGVQCRNQLTGCWRYRDPSGQNDIARRDLLTVQTTVVAVVRPDGGAFEGDSGKQATRP